MKKAILGMALMYGVSTFGVANAAANVSDVPSDHWAYPAVTALIKDGIIDGYNDGTFKGDKTVSRYEMAQIVEKAMDNSGKATAKQKALIDKLASEFALEINKIDVKVTNIDKRVAKLEDANKKTMKVGFDAMIAYNIDSAPAGIASEQGPEKLISRYRLRLGTDISDTTSFFMRLGTTFSYAGATQNTDKVGATTNAFIDQGYFTFKNVWGLNSIRLGRQGITELGAFVVQKGQHNDGITLEKQLNDSTTLRAGMSYIKVNNDATVGEDQTFNFVSWNKTFGDNSGVKLLYGSARDTQGVNNARGIVGYTGSRLVGVNAYTKMGDWTVSSEYVRASLGGATNSEHPHAWSVQFTNAKAPVKRASLNLLKDPFVDLNKVGDNAFSVAYHYLGAGVQPNGMGSWTNALGMSTEYGSASGSTRLKDNVKGWIIDYQYVLTKGFMVDVTYQKLKAANTIGAVNAGDKKLDCLSIALATLF